MSCIFSSSTFVFCGCVRRCFKPSYTPRPIGDFRFQRPFGSVLVFYFFHIFLALRNCSAPGFYRVLFAPFSEQGDCRACIRVRLYFCRLSYRFLWRSFFSCTGFFKEQILGNRYLPVRARNPATELSNGPTIELMKMLFDRFMRKKKQMTHNRTREREKEREKKGQYTCFH